MQIYRATGYGGLLLFAADAHAYIGPGAGVTVMGAFFSLLLAIGISLLMVLAWPVWIFWKRRQVKRKENKGHTGGDHR